VAALTPVPVYGVPVPTRHLQGPDSLLSIVQMPKGVPVAPFAIGEAGAINAALHVVAGLATTDADTRKRLNANRHAQTHRARAAAADARLGGGAVWRIFGHGSEQLGDYVALLARATDSPAGCVAACDRCAEYLDTVALEQ